MRITVTLARQLGSAGSYLGQHVADNLGIRCLDREIISGTARHLERDEDEVADREERVSSFWERMLRGISAVPPEALYQPPLAPSVSDQQLFTAETEVMQSIAAQEDCLIVGRVAAQVIKPHPGMVNFFLHAPLSFRVPRVMEHYGAADAAQAKAMIAQSDENRKRWIIQMTGQVWDDARCYHLGIDTSALPLPEIADLMTDFVRRRLTFSGG
jgi:cytidylate kinase